MPLPGSGARRAYLPSRRAPAASGRGPAAGNPPNRRAALPRTGAVVPRSVRQPPGTAAPPAGRRYGTGGPARDRPDAAPPPPPLVVATDLPVRAAPPVRRPPGRPGRTPARCGPRRAGLVPAVLRRSADARANRAGRPRPAARPRPVVAVTGDVGWLCGPAGPLHRQPGRTQRAV